MKSRDASVGRGEADDPLGLPATCLVVRESGEIRGLYPASVGDASYTVEDGLRAVETGTDELNLA